MSAPGPVGRRRNRYDRPGVVASAATVAVGTGCAVVAWVVAGPWGAASAMLAVLVVLAFFASGSVPLVLAQQADLPVRAGMGLLLLTYVLRLALVLAILAVLSGVDRLHAASLGVTLIVCALVWSGARLVAVLAASRAL
jgi:hypothetical protein